MSSHAWAHTIEATNQYLLLYGPLVTSKNSNSHLNLFEVERILHSDWPWRFRIITQEPDFSKTFCFLQKVERPLTLPCSTKNSYIFELIIFSLKSKKPYFRDFLSSPSPLELLFKNQELSLFLLSNVSLHGGKI